MVYEMGGIAEEALPWGTSRAPTFAAALLGEEHHMRRIQLCRLPRNLVFLGALALPAAVIAAGEGDYTGHKIVRVEVQSTDQIEKIHEMHALLLSEGMVWAVWTT